jgi:hypothetical protein
MWNLKKKAKYMQRIAWQLAGAEKERKWHPSKSTNLQFCKVDKSSHLMYGIRTLTMLCYIIKICWVKLRYSYPHPNTHAKGQLCEMMDILIWLATRSSSLLYQNIIFTLGWCHMPIIPDLWRLRQEDHEFEASLGYIASSGLVWDIQGDPVSKTLYYIR